MRLRNGLWFILVSVAFLLLPGWGAVAAAAPSLDVSGGAPPVAYRQVAKGQTDAVNFTVTPSTGWYPGEGAAPGITYEEVDISADSSTTIAGVTASVPGGVWHPANSGGKYIFDESCPAAPFQLTVGVSSNAIGTHNVTADGTTITLSDGESGGGTPCTESFQVVLIAVHISGPPNVIYDNGPGTTTVVPGGDNIYNPPPNVHSEYSATATGGSGSYNWTWTLPANVAFASGYYDTSEPIEAYGTAGGHPGTPEEIWCQANDNESLEYGVNTITVNLEQEYWHDWTSEKIIPNTTGALNQGNAQPVNANQASQVTFTAGTAASVSVGLSVGGAYPAADFGLNASSTTESEVSTGSTLTLGGQTTSGDWQAVLVPQIEQLNGTGYVYGPYGLVGSEPITNTRKNPMLEDAEFDSSVKGTPTAWANNPQTVYVDPVQPW